MYQKFTLMLITLALLIPLTGCNAPVKSTSTPGSGNSQNNTYPSNSTPHPSGNQQLLPLVAGQPADLVLDISADGTTQQLKLGETIAVSLESNPSTGYSWFSLVSNPNVIAQMGEPQYQAPSSSSTTPVVGAPGTALVYFKAIGAGSSTITLEYKRGWETGVAPAKSITINVDVK